MIRVYLGPRLIRSARRLGASERSEVEAALASAARSFGNPRAHSGLGLRKFSHALWECRVGSEWRIVFIQEADGLRAFDLMSHDEIRKWLRSHPV